MTEAIHNVEDLYGELGSAMDGAAILSKNAAIFRHSNNLKRMSQRKYVPEKTMQRTLATKMTSRTGISSGTSTQRASKTQNYPRQTGRANRFDTFINSTRKNRQRLRESLPQVTLAIPSKTRSADPESVLNKQMANTSTLRPPELAGLYSAPETRYLPTPAAEPYTPVQAKTVYMARKRSVPSSRVTSVNSTPQRPSKPVARNFQASTASEPQIIPVQFQSPAPAHEYVNIPVTSVVNPPPVTVHPPPVNLHVNTPPISIPMPTPQASTQNDAATWYMYSCLNQLQQTVNDLRVQQRTPAPAPAEPTSRTSPMTEESLLSLLTTMAMKEYASTTRPHEPVAPVTVNVTPSESSSKDNDIDRRGWDAAQQAMQSMNTLTQQLDHMQKRWADAIEGRNSQVEFMRTENEQLKNTVDSLQRAVTDLQHRKPEANKPTTNEVSVNTISTMVEHIATSLSGAYTGHIQGLIEETRGTRDALFALLKEVTTPEPPTSQQIIPVPHTSTPALQVNSHVVQASIPPSRQPSVSEISSMEESGMDIADYLAIHHHAYPVIEDSAPLSGQASMSGESIEHYIAMHGENTGVTNEDNASLSEGEVRLIHREQVSHANTTTSSRTRQTNHPTHKSTDIPPSRQILNTVSREESTDLSTSTFPSFDEDDVSYQSILRNAATNSNATSHTNSYEEA